jgi:hypothetical protein
MAGEKLLRANVQILAAYPEAFADPTAPTAAELNDQFAYGTNEDAMVFNISCAILDDYTLNMSDPETDDSISICDIGNVETPTFDNYEASLDGFRDRSVTDNGVFNLFFDLFKGVDRPFFLIKRIGKAQNAAYLTNGSDVISMYGVKTDFPVDLVEDNTMLQFGARFKTTGDLNTNYSVVS